MLGRKGDDEIAMVESRSIRRQEKAAIRRTRNRLDGAPDVGSVFDWVGYKLDCQRRSRGYGPPQKVVIGRRLGVGDECSAR